MKYGLTSLYVLIQDASNVSAKMFELRWAFLSANYISADPIYHFIQIAADNLGVAQNQ